MPIDDQTPEAATPSDVSDRSSASTEQLGTDLFDPAGLTETEKRALLVSLLFASGEVVPRDRLQEFFQLGAEQLTVLVEEAAGELRPRGLDILSVAGGCQLVTASPFDNYLSRFYQQLRKARVSKSALEVLAVVAYEQPVTRSRVDELRQVNSESSLRTLLDRRLITVAGRAESPGRPFLYRTTDAFLAAFGLSTLADLPPRPASFSAADSEAPAAALPSLDELPGFDTASLEEDESD